ncbi:hypothetical protein BVRB_2g029130 [Beta vulgaris subsp. vulgaris]|nr:hypothetical protein BVRB_2g029130 [Beta vulgaris subsp. vulgaris]
MHNRTSVGVALSAAQTLFSALQWDADKKDISDHKTQLYIQQLKDAVYNVYNADDLLDEFVTLAEHKQHIKGGKASKKLHSFFSTHNPLLAAHKMSQKVKKIMEKFDAIASNHSNFGFSVDSQRITKRREETCSYVYEPASCEPTSSTTVGLSTRVTPLLFPSLEELTLRSLPKLQGWRRSRIGVEDDDRLLSDNGCSMEPKLLPQLKILVISKGPGLECTLLFPVLERSNLNFNKRLQIRSTISHAKELGDEKVEAMASPFSFPPSLDIEQPPAATEFAHLDAVLRSPRTP